MRNLCLIFTAVCFLTACATAPPVRQHNICAVFEQHPDWYDYARESEKTWGIPIQILMAFVMNESGYRGGARPERDWVLFIPLGRKSSARGYAQAKDPVWKEYKQERGGLFRSRGLNLNIKGAMFCCQAVMPGMIKQKYGKICNISSSVVKMAFSGVAGVGARGRSRNNDASRS